MDLNQALLLIDGALSTLTVTREAHARLQTAVQTIAEGIKKLEECEKCDSNKE